MGVLCHRSTPRLLPDSAGRLFHAELIAIVLANRLGGLIAYCQQPKKPSLDRFPPAGPAA